MVLIPSSSYPPHPLPPPPRRQVSRFGVPDGMVLMLDEMPKRDSSSSKCYLLLMFPSPIRQVLLIVPSFLSSLPGLTVRGCSTV